MGWTELCIDVLFNAKEKMPEHVCDATYGEAAYPEHGEFIPSWYCLLPGLSFRMIEHNRAEKHHGDDQKSGVKDTMPGSKERL